MVVGLGIDVVELDRIERSLLRFGERFLRKALTPFERSQFPTNADWRRVEFLAARFAAKEAASKALGSGFRQGVSLQTIEVRHLPSGKPELFFLDAASLLVEQLQITSSHVSLTHGRDVAAAVVVLEKEAQLL